MEAFNYSYLAYPEKMYKFWKDEMMCDVTLIAELDKIKVFVHRLVLCASTDFFDGLLTSELKEQQHNEIVVKNISGATLQNVIHFFYTGNIEINTQNAESLLAAASLLLSPKLERKCTDFFEQPGIIDASNCIGIWAIARKYAFHELKTVASQAIYEQFLEVSKNGEFLRLDDAHLVELLGSDKMNITSEEDVFNAIVDWVQFKVDERKLLFPKIVAAVRIHQLNEKFMLRNVFTACKRFECLDTMDELCEVKNDGNMVLSKRALVSPDLLAISFENMEIKIETFSRRFQKWKFMDNIEIKKTWFGAEFVDQHLYIIGGRNDKDTPVNTVERINLKTQDHQDLQPMLQPRSAPSIWKMNGYIYAVGGVNEVHLSSAEKYDIDTDKWTTLAPMSIGRLYAAIADLAGTIFLMGGRSSSGPNGCLATVECYNPATNVWSNVAPMISKRAGARAGAANGKLYIVGGFDGSNYLSTIERYDQEENEWTMINIQLNNARCDFGLVLYENQIVVAGGGSVNGGQSCEQLDILSGQKKYVLPMVASKICCHLFQFNN